MKLLVLSSRRHDLHISYRNWAAPLENALAQFPGATLVSPPGLRQRPRRSVPSWLAAARVARRADVVFWNQEHLHPPPSVWALAYANPLACRAVYSTDAWESVVADLARLVDAQSLAVCFVEYLESQAAMQALDPRLDVRWLPVGFARDVFQDLGLERDVYAFWLGRRHESLHGAIAKFCKERGLTYVFSRHANDPATLDELRMLCARSRYFVVTPPDLNDKARTGSFSPMTLRYLEGLGAGCRLLGVRPGSGEFEMLFPADAIVECRPDGSDLEEVLSAADSDPDWEAKQRRATEIAHAEHGWERRAQVVYDALVEKLEQA